MQQGALGALLATEQASLLTQVAFSMSNIMTQTFNAGITAATANFTNTSQTVSGSALAYNNTFSQHIKNMLDGVGENSGVQARASVKGVA